MESTELVHIQLPNSIAANSSTIGSLSGLVHRLIETNNLKDELIKLLEEKIVVLEGNLKLYSHILK